MISDNIEYEINCLCQDRKKAAMHICVGYIDFSFVATIIQYDSSEFGLTRNHYPVKYKRESFFPADNDSYLQQRAAVI
jgi:hypothetical protein